MPTVLTYRAPGWGVGELWLEGARVLLHELPQPRRDGSDGDHALVDRLRRYFAGDPVGFGDVELGVEWPTEFAAALAETLRGVPRGEVVTYGELAALGGRPGAARAAGSFCARNPLPIFVPCHRVVAAGGLGPYGSLGGQYKRRLLELEGYAAR